MKTVDHALLVNKRTLATDTFALDLRSQPLASQAAPGNFVMIRGGERQESLTPRPISIFALLFEDGEPVGFTLLVKVLGAGTKAICDRRPGERLLVTGPLGNSLQVNPAGRYLMVAGGTGIAPTVFVAQEIGRIGGEYAILYGGKSAGDLHTVELERHGFAARLATEDGSIGHRGLVTELLGPALDAAAENTAVFACGPWLMMKRASGICAERGIACFCSLERYMACGFGACLSCVYRSIRDGEYRTCCKDGPVVDGREVDWDA